MKILQVKKLEDCFDGSTIYEYKFDSCWTYENIKQLSKLGELNYYKDFPRPFFRLNGEQGMQIKGVEGESSFTVFFPKDRKEEMQRALEGHFKTNRTE